MSQESAGDGGDDGEQHRERDADGEDQRLDLMAVACRMLVRGNLLAPLSLSPAHDRQRATSCRAALQTRAHHWRQSWHGGDLEGPRGRSSGECLQEFKEFALTGNVVDMAVGIIIGAAFGTIVRSLVDDIVMPPLGLLTGGVDFSNMFIALNGEIYPSLAAAKQAGAPTINFGVFINNVIASPSSPSCCSWRSRA